MSFDGRGAWSENSIYDTGAANAPESKFNQGRSSNGAGTGGRGICPPNWHVPTDFEWGVILDGMESGGGTAHQNAPAAGGYGINAGARGKARCTVPDQSTTGGIYVNDQTANWYYKNGATGTDAYGFRVLPAGRRYNDGSNFNYRGAHAYFWSSSANSSSSAWYRYFYYGYATVYRYTTSRSFGFSVRCIRDNFTPGAIISDTATAYIDANPNVTVQNANAASGGRDNHTYVWVRTGTSSATLTGSEADYNIHNDASNYSAAGTYHFNRYVNNDIYDTFVAATGTYTLIVKPGDNQPQGGCTFTPPPEAGSFADFPNNYGASTFVTLTDDRDGKNYAVVKIANRWIMAQNLNYQKDLTWQANANQPSTAEGQNPALIGHFWCPGGYSSAVTTSTRASCEVWGALYSWETAMSFDGKGAWTENTTYNTGAANAPGSKFNHGRSWNGSGTGGRGICPPNWHVPTDHEWGVILDGMESGGGTAHQNAPKYDWYGIDAGSRAKARCTAPDQSTTGTYVNDQTANWYYYNGATGTDAYGFRVLPAGRRYYIGSYFHNRGIYAYFWSSSANSSSNAWYRYFNYGGAGVYRSYTYRSNGISVRCIRDNFSPGAITSGTATVYAGVKPNVTVQNAGAASGGSGTFTYVWVRTGMSSATLTGSGEAYNIGSDGSNYSAAGTYYINRYVKDGVSNTPVASTGTYTLIVKLSVNQAQSSCTFTQPPLAGTFADFPSNYSASTFVTLVDERDGNKYTAVKIANRWIMAQNLNYQKDLTWQEYVTQPSTVTGHNPALIGHFWCPGGYSSEMVTSTRASCWVWGALYSWETAMLFDGKGAWTENTTYNTGAANATGSKFNHGRSSNGAGTGGRGICPPSWHVPTDFEWGVILDGMESRGRTVHQDAPAAGDYGDDVGMRGKARCTVPGQLRAGNTYVNDQIPNWYYHTDITSIDAYGFRVLPAGRRFNNGFAFINRGNYAYFWSSSAYDGSIAWGRFFSIFNNKVNRSNTSRSSGFSVRCIRD